MIKIPYQIIIFVVFISCLQYGNIRLVKTKERFARVPFMR